MEKRLKTVLKSGAIQASESAGAATTLTFSHK